MLNRYLDIWFNIAVLSSLSGTENEKTDRKWRPAGGRLFFFIFSTIKANYNNYFESYHFFVSEYLGEITQGLQNSEEQRIRNFNFLENTNEHITQKHPMLLTHSKIRVCVGETNL